MFQGCAVDVSGLQTIAVERLDIPATLERGRNLKVATWNLLAPPYFRVGGGLRESHFPDRWRRRLTEQIEIVGQFDADVILLQEFWFDEPEVFDCWRSHFAPDYAFFGSPRTRSKEDGVLTMVRYAWLDTDTFEMRTISFDDWGDRVASVLRLGNSLPTIVNTHLTFPHRNAHDPVMRKAQAKKLSEYLLTEWPGGYGSAIVIGGDLNGDVYDPACRLLHENGFIPHTREHFVSHISHRGDHMGCDFVLVYSPPPIACARSEDKEGSLSVAESQEQQVHVGLTFGAHSTVGNVEKIGSDGWPSDHIAVTVLLAASTYSTVEITEECNA